MRYYGMILFLIIGIVHTPLESMAKERAPRKGLIIAYHNGFTYVEQSEGGIGGSGGVMGGLRLGWGVTERVLVFADKMAAFVPFEALVGTIIASAQVFPMKEKGVYLRPGIGMGVVIDSLVEDDNEGAGLATSVAAGYEFRLKKHVALSPELRWDYVRAKSENYHIIGVVADLRWYF